MRFDLTVNQFTYESIKNKNLEVYDADTWRPYCHVLDFARAIENIIYQKNTLVNKQVFNVGTHENNATKRMLVNKIKSIIGEFKIVYKDNGNDARNYKVNFKKINQTLGFRPQFSLDYGINEISEYIKNNKNYIENSLETMGNYTIKNQIIRRYKN